MVLSCKCTAVCAHWVPWRPLDRHGDQATQYLVGAGELPGDMEKYGMSQRCFRAPALLRGLYPVGDAFDKAGAEPSHSITPEDRHTFLKSATHLGWRSCRFLGGLRIFNFDPTP